MAKRFNSETERDDFRSLCTEVFPAIERMEQVFEKRGIAEDATVMTGDKGYLALNIHGSKWKMVRYKKDWPVEIVYEHSEELSIPAGRAFDRVSENLVEISFVFAGMQKELRDGPEIDSLTWKQEFVAWANEFERIHQDTEWGTDGTGDYPEAIEEFAKEKIRSFAGLDGQK